MLWRLGYGLTQPRIVHKPLQLAMSVITGRQVSEAFEQYQPDLVVSVHPLMQVPPPSPILVIATSRLTLLLCYPDSVNVVNIGACL